MNNSQSIAIEKMNAALYPYGMYAGYEEDTGRVILGYDGGEIISSVYVDVPTRTKSINPRVAVRGLPSPNSRPNKGYLVWSGPSDSIGNFVSRYWHKKAVR